MDAKKYLIETFKFFIHQLETDSCTMDEINSAAQTIESNMRVNGTISDFAEFFGQSENNIRAVIARKLLAKPKRILLYPFQKFLKIISDRWNVRK